MSSVWPVRLRTEGFCSSSPAKTSSKMRVLWFVFRTFIQNVSRSGWGVEAGHRDLCRRAQGLVALRNQQKRSCFWAEGRGYILTWPPEGHAHGLWPPCSDWPACVLLLPPPPLPSCSGCPHRGRAGPFLVDTALGRPAFTNVLGWGSNGTGLSPRPPGGGDICVMLHKDAWDRWTGDPAVVHEGDPHPMEAVPSFVLYLLEPKVEGTSCPVFVFLVLGVGCGSTLQAARRVCRAGARALRAGS